MDLFNISQLNVPYEPSSAVINIILYLHISMKDHFISIASFKFFGM